VQNETRIEREEDEKEKSRRRREMKKRRLKWGDENKGGRGEGLKEGK
jgi:hypothetical protein